jgi:hypothetical protein
VASCFGCQGLARAPQFLWKVINQLEYLLLPARFDLWWIERLGFIGRVLDELVNARHLIGGGSATEQRTLLSNQTQPQMRSLN